MTHAIDCDMDEDCTCGGGRQSLRAALIDRIDVLKNLGGDLDSDEPPEDLDIAEQAEELGYLLSLPDVALDDATAEALHELRLVEGNPALDLVTTALARAAGWE